MSEVRAHYPIEKLPLVTRLPDELSLENRDDVVGEPVAVEGGGEGYHYRYRHNRQNVHYLKKSIN